MRSLEKMGWSRDKTAEDEPTDEQKEVRTSTQQETCKGFQGFHLKNGSSQGQNLAWTVLFVLSF